MSSNHNFMTSAVLLTFHFETGLAYTIFICWIFAAHCFFVISRSVLWEQRKIGACRFMVWCVKSCTTILLKKFCIRESCKFLPRFAAEMRKTEIYLQSVGVNDLKQLA